MSSTTAAATTTSVNTANPTTPVYADDVEWITAYLVIHMMSDSSRRYTYLLWVVVAIVFLVFALLHWTGSRGGFVGAYWSKWSLRRRTWRKQHKIMLARTSGHGHHQPTSLPSNAQLLCLSVLLLFSMALAFAGPDYIAPGVKLWEFDRPDSHRKRASIDISQFYQYQPQYTIPKAWWTAGGRTGLVAFALFPLCILFALKAPPFAIFAIPFMIQLHFDKLAWLHRWCGRLIWLLSALHVALWSVQLGQDHRNGTGKVAYTYAWQYEKFIYGWIAFGLLTLLVGFSLFPLRRAYYEAFYFLHVLLIPLTLITAAMHHPPVWWWCWIALGLWVGERMWRATWWLHSNGFFGGIVASAPPNPEELARQYVPPARRQDTNDGFQRKGKESVSHPLLESQVFPFPAPRDVYPPSPHSHSVTSPLNPHLHNSPPRSPYARSPSSSWTPAHSVQSSFSSTHQLLSAPASSTFMPPAGYAHCELLSGRTVRVRLITPGFLSWAPGQHFLISMPSISKVTSHPFTAASVCDEQAPTDAGREIVMLVRAKQGWTKELWDQVVNLTTRGQTHPSGEMLPRGTVLPKSGVLMRTCIDGPFGSAVRARWGHYSTVLIIAGGSGVSFGLAVLQYICLCLSGRDGKFLGGRPGGWGHKGFSTTRVRFVWLVREFCHIQWCASILRRCMAMIPPPGLQVDIFVTNFKPIERPRGRPRPPPISQLATEVVDGHLAPPAPRFSGGRGHSRSSSRDSMISTDTAVDSLVDLSYYAGEFDDGDDDEQGDLGRAHQNHLLDLTNFDGDDDTALPGEDALNQTVKKAGKLRRAKTRKAEKAVAAKEKLDERASKRRSDLAAKRLSGQSLFTLSSPVEGRSESGHTSSLHRPNEVDLTNVRTTSPTLDSHWHTPHLHSPLAVEVPRTLTSPLPFDDSPSASRPSSPMSYRDGKADTSSVRELMPQVGTGARGEQVRLEVSDSEMRDVDVVAEYVRSGKPKVDRILSDEVQESKGAVVVACCGPSSLNAMVRKAIANQIDPSRLRRGDLRGSIALVSEEFEY